jgi:predicted alpha-1,2-mannosidase
MYKVKPPLAIVNSKVFYYLTLMKKLLLFILLPVSLFAQKQAVDYVKPMIGSAEHGHTYPGATVPFGMVQLSPDNGHKGWDWCSGYHLSEDKIVGFANTHLSGTGCSDLGDILLMPAVSMAPPEARSHSSRFKHTNEKSEAGYYSVVLDDKKIKVELTATNRVGVQRYTFPKTNEADIILNLGYGNDDTPQETFIQVDGPNQISGYRFSKGWANNQKLFFTAVFSKPIGSTYVGPKTSIDNKTNNAKGKDVFSVLRFDASDGQPITVKVAISCVGIEGAKKNMAAEAADKSFDDIRAAAKAAWQTELSKVDVEMMNEGDKSTFYTAMYHSMLAPTTYCDVDGQYRGPDDQVHTGTFTNYCTFSLWDTFRAEHPLFTIIQPKRVPDMVNSLMSFQEQGGLLPVWTLQGCETNCMIGYHSIPVIVDAYSKGMTGFDINKAYEAMKKSAFSGKNGLEFLYKDGKPLGAAAYIPSDKEHESVSKALEYAYDDWCIAQVAKALGKTDDYDLFMGRAAYYKNYYDKSTGFMRGKRSNGDWVSPFNPMFATNKQPEYTEGNAWQYSWFVPHDVDGLIALMGGKDHFVSRLDSLFSLKLDLGPGAPPDVSGLIGLYAHGNEPSHHIAYLYAAAGKPGKTQSTVRKIMRTLYNSTNAGLCGNEDCGQMSAWYVFSALGFYPLNPADGKYYIGSPMVKKATLNLDNGKTFTIDTQNQGEANVYVKQILLNGNALSTPFITHNDILAGGKLEFVMSDKE